MMRLLSSLSFRLTLAYVALFCLSVSILMGIHYWINIHAPTTQVRAEIRGEADAMTRIYRQQGIAALVSALDRRAADSNGRKAFHVLVDGRGKVITANIASWPRTGGEWLRFEADVAVDGMEVDYQPFMAARQLDDGTRLLIGRDIEDIDDHEEALRWSAQWIFSGSLLLGLLGALVMNRAIHRRLAAIDATARTVMAGDLSGRISLRGSGDDFDRLGEVLNQMLARIELLVESVRRVSDTIAHDLRTPLSRLRADLEELDPASSDIDRQKVLTRQAIAESNRLQRLFDALLRIARIESGRHAPGMRLVELAPLVEDAVETYLPAAEDRGITLRLEVLTPATIEADPDLVYQALANLIDNALKYVPPRGTVRVRLEAVNEGILMSVSDDGPGVGAEDRARLTERFYRAEAVRDLPGEGLGLSLVAAIAARHDAELQLVANAPGLCVQLLFRVS